MKENQIIEWIETMIEHNGEYCEIYISGLRNFIDDKVSQYQIESNPEKFETAHAPTLREAFKLAIENSKKV